MNPLFIPLLASFAYSQSDRCTLPTRIEPPRLERDDCVNRAKPDMHVLALSWSPDFCQGARNGDPDTRFQCELNRFGFVVHGLWPNRRDARDKCRQPRNCASSLVSDSLVKRFLCIMPGVQLIQGEWEKHGTCSGLSQAGYFAQIDKLWNGLVLPDLRRIAPPSGTLPVRAIRKAFADANAKSGITQDALAVDVRDGDLAEVKICYDLSYKPTRCPAGIGTISGVARIVR